MKSLELQLEEKNTERKGFVPFTIILVSLLAVIIGLRYTRFTWYDSAVVLTTFLFFIGFLVGFLFRRDVKNLVLIDMVLIPFMLDITNSLGYLGWVYAAWVSLLVPFLTSQGIKFGSGIRLKQKG